jgi:WD40 repeat protein
VLWIHGDAASGKSVLSSFIINHLVQLGLPCHYFFFRFTDKKKRAVSLLLRTIAYQLARSTRIYADRLGQLEAVAADLKLAQYKQIWLWLYKQSLFKMEIDRPLYCVIDGVDEADNPGHVVRLLQDLQLTTIPIRILLVSRKTHEISAEFQKLGKIIHLETIHMKGDKNDLKAYIDFELNVPDENNHKTTITEKLLEKAQGNFLWLHLAVDKINSCYTTSEIESALSQLPAGMEDLYHRMTDSVLSQSPGDRRIGQDILAWATYAQRLLTVDELKDALSQTDHVEFHRTISDLCGGFLVVDKEGKVAMIHETAREYLIRCNGMDQDIAAYSLGMSRKITHNRILKRCIQRLIDPKLRSLLGRNKPPALLEYACTSWFLHLSFGSITDDESWDLIAKFLKEQQHVLTWININAKRKDLRSLVSASRCMTDVVIKLRHDNKEEVSLAQQRAYILLEGWATDLVKIVGKFGNNLSGNPDSIYKLIPPFCPENSTIYQQFGKREAKSLYVSGCTSTWDDCLARLSWDRGVLATSVLTAGSRVAILTSVRKKSQIIIYNSITFEEQRRIIHPEHVFRIQVNRIGDKLVSYGYLTTRVWNLATGDCIKLLQNPSKRPRPQTILFSEQDTKIIVGSEDRCIRSFSISEEVAEWKTNPRIDETGLADTILNMPTCSALSPEANMIAFSYRGHPVTVWELEPPYLIGQCNISLNHTDMTVHEHTWGEVVQLAWFPFGDYILGLTLVGLLFKWSPYEEDIGASTQSEGNYLAISSDGSLAATGDVFGTIKLYATSDLSLLYQLSSQDPVSHLSFSADSRHLYDIRGTYGNVWQPNTLIRLADNAAYSENSSDIWDDIESLAKESIQIEHISVKVDTVATLACQNSGPLYCYGTEDGASFICEVGRGKVCDLERLAGYMSVEHVVWSNDGQMVAITDLNGRLYIKRVVKSDLEIQDWKVDDEINISIPQRHGSIGQVFFHKGDCSLFLSTAEAIYTLSLETRQLTFIPLSPDMSVSRWTPHPVDPEQLLGFSINAMYILNWVTLKTVGIWPYSTREGISPLDEKGNGTLGRLIVDNYSSNILLEKLPSSFSGIAESKFLIIPNVNVITNSKINDHDEIDNSLQYFNIPNPIRAQIMAPLAFISRDRLVFLDHDKWLCTWRMVEPSALGQEHENLKLAPGNVERHYFLPGDWAMANEAHLCTLTRDGALLCPRNGDIAVVQSSKLLIYAKQ